MEAYCFKCRSKKEIQNAAATKTTHICGVCGTSIRRTKYVVLDKYRLHNSYPITTKCLHCFLLDVKLLKRSLIICFVVGTILNTLNYGNYLNPTVILESPIKLGLNYLVPFLVSITTAAFISRVR